jgi:hypothetical protein
VGVPLESRQPVAVVPRTRETLPANAYDRLPGLLQTMCDDARRQTFPELPAQRHSAPGRDLSGACGSA